MSHASFDTRIARLNRKHQRLALGVRYRVAPDGLIVAEPPRRLRLRLPLKAILFLLVAGFAFKALLFVGLGETTYESRRALLAGGNMAERAAAWAMQPDPAVRLVAGIVGGARLP